MNKVGLIYFFLSIAIACLTGFIAIRFFDMDDEFRRAFYEKFDDVSSKER